MSHEIPYDEAVDRAAQWAYRSDPKRAEVKSPWEPTEASSWALIVPHD
jgi:hypothetical protein